MFKEDVGTGENAPRRHFDKDYSLNPAQFGERTHKVPLPKSARQTLYAAHRVFVALNEISIHRTRLKPGLFKGPVSKDRIVFTSNSR